MIQNTQAKTGRDGQTSADGLTPPGFRYCPIKKRFSHGSGYIDKYCDRDKCGFWNDDKARCGLIR
jgi:hypothetical protein